MQTWMSILKMEESKLARRVSPKIASILFSSAHWALRVTRVKILATCSLNYLTLHSRRSITEEETMRSSSTIIICRLSLVIKQSSSTLMLELRKASCWTFTTWWTQTTTLKQGSSSATRSTIWSQMNNQTCCLWRMRTWTAYCIEHTVR